LICYYYAKTGKVSLESISVYTKTSLFIYLFFFRTIRSAAADQFFLLALCSTDQKALQTCISVVFSVLNTTVLENAKKSHEYFQVSLKHAPDRILILFRKNFSWSIILMKPAGVVLIVPLENRISIRLQPLQE